METRKNKTNAVVIVLALVGLMWLLSFAAAGSLEPSAPPGPTMYSLDEIFSSTFKSTVALDRFVPSNYKGPSDMYVKFENVNGEAKESGYEGWSDLVSFNQPIIRPLLDSTSPIRQRGDVVLEDIQLVKTLDKASPKLAEAICKGRSFPHVIIHVTASFAEVGRVRYYAYDLTNARVTSYSVSGSGQSEDVPTETMSLNFEEIKVTYTEFDSNGDKKGNVEYTWRVEEGES